VQVLWLKPSDELSFGISHPRDHSTSYPIGFDLVPSVGFVVAWRMVRQVVVTVGLNPLGFVSFTESLATSCVCEPSLIATPRQARISYALALLSLRA